MVAAPIHPADEGDTTTLRRTLEAAPSNLAAVGLAPTRGRSLRLVADKGYHSREALKALDGGAVEDAHRRAGAGQGLSALAWRRRGAAAVYANRARLKSGVGREAMRQRGELVERSFAHILDRGGMRRAWLRGRENVHKRYLIHVAGFNLGVLMRALYGQGTPREAADALNRLRFHRADRRRADFRPDRRDRRRTRRARRRRRRPDLRLKTGLPQRAVTLVAESELQPFFRENGQIKTREMRPHPLPWPTEALTAIPDANVTMRVTLSYFVEPSPGERGWTPRYGYQSHGLRFAVRNPLETEEAFERRINRFVREEDYEAPGLPDPGWQFGRRNSLTSLGCVHSDTWRGKAIELASRGYIAVYPTMGWWNKRPHLVHWRRARVTRSS